MNVANEQMHEGMNERVTTIDKKEERRREKKNERRISQLKNVPFTIANCFCPAFRQSE
jgi:hypothetical protein